MMELNIQQICEQLEDAELLPIFLLEAIVIADDVIFPPELRQGMQTYQDYVRAKPDLDSVEVGIGHGLEVTRKHQAVLPNGLKRKQSFDEKGTR
jgi:hypothetical protein